MGYFFKWHLQKIVPFDQCIMSAMYRLFFDSGRSVEEVNWLNVLHCDLRVRLPLLGGIVVFSLTSEWIIALHPSTKEKCRTPGKWGREAGGMGSC